jgi:hypothetical protein
MKVILYIITFTILAFGHAKAEECIFDIENQNKYLLQLQIKYPESKVTLDEKAIELNYNNGVIKYKRGGCSHFGENITFTTSVNSDYSNKNILFDSCIILMNEFISSSVYREDFKKSLTSNKYKFENIGGIDYYYIMLSIDSVIEPLIRYHQENGNHIIEISYYIN